MGSRGGQGKVNVGKRKHILLFVILKTIKERNRAKLVFHVAKKYRIDLI